MNIDIKTFESLNKLADDIDYHSRKLSKVKQEAIELLKAIDIYCNNDSLVQRLQTLINENEERIEREKEEVIQATLNKKADAKTKTLKRAMDNAKALGLDFCNRPKVWFGTTDDHILRIVGLSQPDKEGNMKAIIWNRGGSWTDNSGSHYTESWLDIDIVAYDENGRLVYGNGSVGKGSKSIIEGGKLTVPRLEAIKDKIKAFIPGFEPALMPWEYTLIYPDK